MSIVLPDTDNAMVIAAKLARRFEGLRLRAYICVAGYPTIGFGSVLRGVRLDDIANVPPITEAEAEALLTQDLRIANAAVGRQITVPLSNTQRAALIDWTFNLGASRLRASTMRAMINRGELAGVTGEMRKWVFGGGRRLPGLVARREAEVALWNAA